jgi:hypothetical protein
VSSVIFATKRGCDRNAGFIDIFCGFLNRYRK